MIFKQGQLVAILGCSQALESKYLDPINAACTKFNINTMLRLAAFIAQVGHESGRLATTIENLNYSADGLVKTWPSRFTAATAAASARQPQKIANIVYASRMGNGNEASGDGWKYRGRGLIQVTGKSNYDAYSQASGFNAIGNPDALAEAVHASMSAGWFWDSKGLNAYADRSDFTSITKRINGGTNGQADRELLYKKAIIVLSGGVPPKDDVVDKAPLPVPPAGAPTTPVSTDKTPGAQNSSIVEPRAAQGSDSKSKYPWNFVNVSRSGHISEVDDTPGYERLNMTHRTGSYWEIDNTGTYTTKSILDAYKLTKYDSYDYVGGNYTQQVKGQSYVQSNGDMVIKCGGVIYYTTNKVQMNVGMLAVSGEINAPNINATIFSGLGGMAFGDMLAKEAMVAYDIKKGKAPMLGQSLGFKSAPGASESGSADDLMPNKLDKQSPSGTPWITNGISTAAGVVTVAAMAAGIADLFKKDTPSKELENALKSAADDIDKAAAQSAKETPVFVKHVTFAQPTLVSQSTVLDKPDPSLYVNNIHTIVSSTGKGRLHMSNGIDWIPIGDAAAADHDYTDDQIAIVIDKINQNEVSTTNKILAEAQERAAAVLNEATLRQAALEEEARARQQQITSGLLAEATARGAAIQAESVIRQGEDESLANRILELTASSSAEIAAAIAEERQARTTAIEAEAFLRLQLAAKVDQNTASITEETITRSTETSALSTRITNYIASNDANIASFKTEINVKVDDQGNALSTRIDAQQAANAANAAAIISESTSRVTADGALSTRIDTVFASTESNRVAIQTETTARTTADTALGQRIDTLTATVTGGLIAGVNILGNSGFIVGGGTDGASPTVPLYWGATGAYGLTTSALFDGGPDGYKFARVTFSAASVVNNIRNGLFSVNYAETIVRQNTDYIFAARVRANSDSMVGRQITLVNTNNPFTATIISQPVLTKNWQWLIVKCRWANNVADRNFYITTVLGDSNPIGTHTYDVATPIVHEGSVFLGFNLGTDQRILINTATISTEQTVRAAADSALSSRVDVVSSQTAAAATTANWDGVSGKPLDTTNLVLTPNFEGGDSRTWPGHLIIDVAASDNVTWKKCMAVDGRNNTEQNTFVVIPGERLYFSASMHTASATAILSFGLVLQDQNKANISFPQAVALAPGNVWTTLSGIIDIPTTNIRYATPFILLNTFTTAGTAFITNLYIGRSQPGATRGATWGVDVNGSSAVDQQVTNAQNAANAAQTSATAANAELANIASDNVLSKGEKPTVLMNWQTIDGEVNNIRSQADAFGVSRTAYDISYQNLSNYLTSIGPGSGGWADSTVNSPIVGTTFRANWSNYYTAKINILNAITTRAKALADQGIATNAASIVNEATARTTGDQANATAIQTVSTTVAGHTSTISQQQSSIQGVQANYGIKINNNGYVSGFGLLSEPVNGNIISAFNILADKFAIQAPNLNGGTPVVPFSVDSTTTPPTISLNGLIRIGGTSDGTGGKNVCLNSGPSRSTISGYTMGYNPAGALGPTLGYDPYRPIGGGGVYTRLAGTSTTVSDLANTNGGNYYLVMPGKRYELSIYINTHRCNAYSLIVWQDAAGNYISENSGNNVGNIGAGSDIGLWGRSVWIGAAPNNAYRCYIAVRTQYLGAGNGDPYTFTTMWYLGQAGDNQTKASPWSPSGVTTINGGQIETDSISAISSNIGLMRTAASGGRTEIEANVIRVYDDGNQLRVKMGRLT